jgi:5'-3' exonuclease
MTRLHLVDGTFELFRGHFSNRPAHPKKAVIALCTQLLWLLHDDSEAVTHIAVAFDNPIRSFRNELFLGYKTEEGVDAALLAQFDLAEEAARALGLTVWSMDRWEADDALATGAARFCDDVDQVRILTPDKDLGQSLRGTRVVQIDRMRKKEVDEARLLELRGIVPGSVPDWLALVGDTSDGIPGIPGFGEKTASALLKAYARLEAIPRDARRWDVPVRGIDRLCDSLFSRWEDALLYRKLATLVTDVPLKESLADLEWKGVPRAEFEAWRERVGAGDLPARVRRWA